MSDKYEIDERYIRKISDYQPVLLPRPTLKTKIILIDTGEGRRDE